MRLKLMAAHGLPARTIIIASGAEYRTLPLQNLVEFEGAGVYYCATFIEAQLCGSEEVIVVGGGNQRGKPRFFLSQTAKHVHVLIRSGALADTMSRYLIRRIEEKSGNHPSHAHRNCRLGRKWTARARAMAEQSDRGARDSTTSGTFS